MLWMIYSSLMLWILSPRRAQYLLVMLYLPLLHHLRKPMVSNFGTETVTLKFVYGKVTREVCCFCIVGTHIISIIVYRYRSINLCEHQE